MLTRVLTSLVAIVIVLAALWFIPVDLTRNWFAAFLFTLFSVEWLAITGWQKATISDKVISVILTVVVGLLVCFVFVEDSASNLQSIIQGLFLVLWLVCIGIVLAYRKTHAWLTDHSAVLRYGGILLVGGSLHALAFVYSNTIEEHFLTFIGLIAIVCLTDTGAFFTGRAFGSKPFFAHISPNKTVEGLIGGCVVGASGGILLVFLDDSFLSFVTIWYVVPLIIVFAVFGDLFFSAVKRIQGVKDFGAFFPGHGGVLDRFDSILPAFVPLALLFGMGAS